MTNARAIEPLSLDAGYFTTGNSIPLDECEADHCKKCKNKFDDYAYFADDDLLCERCLVTRGEAILERANAFARRHCKLTGALEVFDPAMRDAPTREEYAAGLREAYTENSVRARNRHGRTNYDELITGLKKESFKDQIFYTAIRYRIDQLLGWEDEHDL